MLIWIIGVACALFFALGFFVEKSIYAERFLGMLEDLIERAFIKKAEQVDPQRYRGYGKIDYDVPVHNYTKPFVRKKNNLLSPDATFTTKADAEEVLDLLEYDIRRKGYATLDDFCDHADLLEEKVPICSKYGWTSLAGSSIKLDCYLDEWTLTLPEPILLTKDILKPFSRKFICIKNPCVPDMVQLPTKEEAESVLSEMRTTISANGFVSVAMLSSYADIENQNDFCNKWEYGWTDVSEAYITQDEDGRCYLNLPNFVIKKQ